MTVYIDNVGHMMADGGKSELTNFAHMLGLSNWNRHWHPRHPHYDVPKKWRARALELGAVQVISKELVEKCIHKDG